MYICALTSYRLAIPESKGIQTETADMSLNLEYKDRFSSVSYHEQSEEELATTQPTTNSY
jgi:hypothetical protein